MTRVNRGMRWTLSSDRCSAPQQCRRLRGMVNGPCLAEGGTAEMAQERRRNGNEGEWSIGALELSSAGSWLSWADERHGTVTT